MVIASRRQFIAPEGRQALLDSVLDSGTGACSGTPLQEVPLVAGTLLFDKYLVGRERRTGGPNMYTAFAEDMRTKLPVVLKFYFDPTQFSRDVLFCETLKAENAAAFVPQLLDAFEATGPVWMRDSLCLPPCMAFERGDCRLLDWLYGDHNANSDKSPRSRIGLVDDLVRAVDFLHARQVVHRQLCPANFMWFGRQGLWKLINHTLWARSGEAVPTHYNLRYAAPELLIADLAGENSVIADPAVDLWALGLMAYEVLSGGAVFGDDLTDDQVISMLLGYSKLPWEEDPGFFQEALSPAACTLVGDLLHRSPDSRKPTRNLIHSPLFQRPITAHCGPADLLYSSPSDTLYSSLRALLAEVRAEGEPSMPSTQPMA